MIVLAVASGTSADGLDVGAVRFERDEHDPATLVADVLDTWTDPWPAGVRDDVLALLPPATTTAAALCAADQAVGQAVAGAARAALERVPGVDLVVSPGQTVFHDVRPSTGSGSVCVGTLQIGQPAWAAEATGLPVVSDLRARDVAAGGHGAPLAGVLDRLWLGGSATRVALNLGGIANVTVVEPGAVSRAWDTGPANCLLDVVAARALGRPFDADGALAASGRVDEALLARLLGHRYFAQPAPKSTGREVFSAAWLDEVVDGEPWADVAATLVELTAVTVADAVAPHRPSEVVASGGGTANPVLMTALGRRLGDVPLVTSDAHGLPAEGKEAVLWALLGWLAWHQVPVSAGGPHPARVLGRITPGHAPVVLPPAGQAPARLLVPSPQLTEVVAR